MAPDHIAALFSIYLIEHAAAGKPQVPFINYILLYIPGNGLCYKGFMSITIIRFNIFVHSSHVSCILLLVCIRELNVYLS